MNEILIYSTPIWEGELSVYDEKTKENILSVLKKYDLKENKINPNSRKDIYKEKEFSPLIEQACEYVDGACDSFGIVDRNIFVNSAWIQYLNSNIVGIEENLNYDTFSGIICIKSSENSGKLCIRNISINHLWSGLILCDKKNNLNAKQVKINLEEGKIIIWPSYLPVSFDANKNDEETILIYFNCFVIPKSYEEELKK
jgi:hypothetical protein